MTELDDASFGSRLFHMQSDTGVTAELDGGGVNRVKTVTDQTGGFSWTGETLDIEPRLVAGTPPQIRMVWPRETPSTTARLRHAGSGAGSYWAPLSDGTAWALYFLLRTIPQISPNHNGSLIATNQNFVGLGLILRRQRTGLLEILVHNGSDPVAVVRSLTGVSADNSVQLLGFRHDGSGNFSILHNSIQVANGAAVAAFGTGSTGDDTCLFNDSSGANEQPGDHVLAIGYTGVNHTDEMSLEVMQITQNMWPQFWERSNGGFLFL